MARAEPLRIEVAYCPRPGSSEQVMVELAVPATLGDALRASGLLERHGLDAQTLQAGVWGRVQPLETVLRASDRVEIYRPLTVDPKEARRLRYKRQRKREAPAR